MNYMNSPLSQMQQSAAQYGEMMPEEDLMTAGWTPEQERRARAAGFPSAQAAADWERARQQRRAPQTVAGQGGAQPTEADRPEGGNAMSWHPRNIFNWLTGLLGGANERNRRQ